MTKSEGAHLAFWNIREQEPHLLLVATCDQWNTDNACSRWESSIGFDSSVAWWLALIDNLTAPRITWERFQ